MTILNGQQITLYAYTHNTEVLSVSTHKVREDEYICLARPHLEYA